MINLKDQYVCQKCGYNMIGFYPQLCPLCGSLNENFITAEECSQTYNVIGSKVNDKIYRLETHPRLGLDHSAYCIKTEYKKIWIDCPSTFTKELEPMDKILFTHHHFLGASNLYRGYYTAFLWIHKEDSVNPIAKFHYFDKKFSQDFKLLGINAFHIGGHTAGFTFYIFEDVLFICDYLIPSERGFILNPYSPLEKTKKGAKKLGNKIEKRDIKIVCGFNYVTEYQIWKEEFFNLLH